MPVKPSLFSSPSGTKNVYDNILDFSTFGGSPGASGATNLAAVSAFNSAYAALSGRTLLRIAPGTYTSSSGWFWAQSGIAGSSLTIHGYGVTLAPTGTPSNSFNGSGGINTSGNQEARFVTSNVGDQTITLVTSGQTSRFSVGQWCMVSGIDMQGYGDPPNLGIFEFAKIQSIGTGTLTFTAPLTNAYKDTWPNYLTGRGGPATVYPMQGFWDQSIECKGINWATTSNLTYGKVRSMTWTDCTFETYGPCPSQALTTTVLRCTATGFGAIEVDKCAHRVEVIDSSLRSINFQSASINELYVNNVNQPTIGGLGAPGWRGGARNSNTFISLTGTNTFNFGAMNYGAMGPTTMTNCSSTTGTWFVNTTPFSDMTEEGGGVLSFSGGPCAPSNTTHYWAVPGQYSVLLDSGNNFARTFRVLDVSSSAGRTYVTTDLPFPVPSSINGRSSPWKIASHPCPSVTMTNCTGNTLFTTHSGLPAGTPFNQWTL